MRAAGEPDQKGLLANIKFSELLLTFVTLPIVNRKDKNSSRFNLFNALRHDAEPISGGDS